MHLFTGTVLGSKYAITINDAYTEAKMVVAYTEGFVEYSLSRNYSALKWSPEGIRRNMIREYKDELGN